MRDRPGIERAWHAYGKKGIEQRYFAPPNIRLSRTIKHEERSANQSKGKRETWDEGFESNVQKNPAADFRSHDVTRMMSQGRNNAFGCGFCINGD